MCFFCHVRGNVQIGESRSAISVKSLKVESSKLKIIGLFGFLNISVSQLVRNVLINRVHKFKKHFKALVEGLNFQIRFIISWANAFYFVERGGENIRRLWCV